MSRVCRSVQRAGTPPRDDESPRRTKRQRPDSGVAGKDEDIPAGEAGRRVAREPQLVVARQRSRLRIIDTRQLLGLVDLELALSTRGLRPSSPHRRHTVEQHLVLAVLSIVTDVDDLPYRERFVGGARVIDGDGDVVVRRQWWRRCQIGPGVVTAPEKATHPNVD